MITWAYYLNNNTTMYLHSMQSLFKQKIGHSSTNMNVARTKINNWLRTATAHFQSNKGEEEENFRAGDTTHR